MSRLILGKRRQGGFILPGMFGGKKGGGASAGDLVTTLRLTSDAANVGTSYTISWPTPGSDPVGAYSSGNPTRLTIPTTGYYDLYACAAIYPGTINPRVELAITKNGTTFLGYARQSSLAGNSAADAIAGRFVQTGILYLTSGDYLECVYTSANSTDDLKASLSMPTLFEIRHIATMSGALVNLTSDATGGPQALSFGAEVYDLNSIWSSGSSLTMPSGFTYANFTGNYLNSDASQNATLTYGVQFTRTSPNDGGRTYLYRQESGITTPGRSFRSGPIAISASDVFNALLATSEVSTQVEADTTTAGVELHSRVSCRVTRSTLLTQNITTETIVTWDAETFDTAGMWAVGDPTKIYPPAGKFRAGAAMTHSGVSGSTLGYCVIRHYDSSNALQAEYYSGGGDSTGAYEHASLTPQITAVLGDYLTVSHLVNTDTSISLSGTAWVEVYP